MNGKSLDVFGIFAKYPQPGKVKSRLAQDIGPQPAADLYAAFLVDTLNRFSSVGDQRSIGYAPSSLQTQEFFSDLAGSCYELWPQPELNLGQRMAAFFEHAFAGGAMRVVLIGSDSPSLPDHFMADAFRLLERNDCVFGPATDGGYYLVGQNRSAWRKSSTIFERIDWSSERVLAQSVQQAKFCQFSVGLLDPWYDVDDFGSLRILVGHLNALAAANQQPSLPRTLEALRNLDPAFDLGL